MLTITEAAEAVNASMIARAEPYSGDYRLKVSDWTEALPPP
jgi:hypothetical protein